MNSSFIVAMVVSAVASAIVFPFGIRLARRFGVVDLPSQRKKHASPMPIVGGICIFLPWFAGMLTAQAGSGFSVLAAAIGALLVLGILDDVKGLSPWAKLSVQLGAAIGTVLLEPNLHALCLRKAEGLALLPTIFLIYTPAVIWIVGVMNAINLIDGIDGFAGGSALLIALCTLALNSLPGGGNEFGMLTLALLIPPLLGFLRYNWAPAKVYLGDNGSLTLGYLLAWNALVHRENPALLVSIPSLFIMFAYPILDMGLCVYRRFRNGYPIFKADRSHLHHRIQRLGLSKSQTTSFLLCLVACSQMAAIFINMVYFRLVVVTIGFFCFTMYLFIYLIGAVEKWRAQTLATPFTLRPALEGSDLLLEERIKITIDLRPLLEVGQWEERAEIQQILSSLYMLIARNVRNEDRVGLDGTILTIYLAANNGEDLDCEIFTRRIRAQLLHFQTLYRVQYSLSGLPIHVVNLEKKPAPSRYKPAAPQRDHVA